MTATNENSVALVLRDSDGNYYLLSEQQIRATKATPEQQEAVRQAIGDVDVSGFAAGPGGFAPLGTLNINVNPVTNVQVGTNVFAGNFGNFAPVTQGVGNVAQLRKP